jgi:hypothetical protein
MAKRRVLDRYTQVLELGTVMKAVLNRGTIPILILIGSMTAVIAYRGTPGLAGFAWISAGLAICLFGWKSRGLGLPLVPVLAIQHFLVYALPIYNVNDSVRDYPPGLVDGAGWETFLFLSALCGSWYIVVTMVKPSRGVAHVVTAFDRQGIAGLRKVGIGLVVASTTYSLLDFLGVTGFIFGLLPSGTASIATAATSAATLAGFFMTSMLIGSRQASPAVKLVFGVCLVASIGLALTSMLLYTILGLVGSVSVGFLWSAGRVPWKFTVLVLALVAFLQAGKTDMRERYRFGDPDSESTYGPATFSTLPSFYGDWFRISFANLSGSQSREVRETRKARASLQERLDNLQNLLFVEDAVEVAKIGPLGGGSYWIIPALLTPRILWPEKPRTHEGQVMLNVHYGRQTEEESFGTYIAWGLLPEAYGNFGPFTGAVFLGVVLGAICAWIECFTALKPLLSIEGLCAFGLLLGFATSFEMVASVFVTSQFQAMVTTAMATLPFVKREGIMARPEESHA